MVAQVDHPSPDLRDVVMLLCSEVVTQAVELSPGGNVEVRVWMAHAAGVLLQRSGFQGGTLAPFQQFAGASYISGNHIEILIHQTWSFDNFATKVPLAYQFIVESR